MRPNLPFVSTKHTLVTYNITLSLITKTNQGPRCFHSVLVALTPSWDVVIPVVLLPAADLVLMPSFPRSVDGASRVPATVDGVS
jgi:hypothetical protein